MWRGSSILVPTKEEGTLGAINTKRPQTIRVVPTERPMTHYQSSPFNPQSPVCTATRSAVR